MKSLHILLIEDDPDDAELLRRELIRCNYQAKIVRVEDAEAMRLAIQDQNIDLIISDFSLPTFSAFEALQIVKESHRVLPFIVLTGTIGEARAVALMKAGADDFILKNQLARLSMAIERELNNISMQETSQAEAEMLLSSLSALLIGLDENRRVTRWNLAAENTFGITSDVAKGAALPELVQQVDWSEVMRGIDRCLAIGATVPINDFQFTTQDGRERFLQLMISRAKKVDKYANRPVQLVILGTDVTARRIEESQRAHGMKMESIGQLAAGIAHEINTPIQFIGDNLRFLADGTKDIARVLTAVAPLVEAAAAAPDLATRAAATATVALTAGADLPYLLVEIPKAIQQSIEGVERLGSIVRAMKEFSFPGQLDKEPANINKALETTLIVARNEYKYCADVVTTFDAALPDVACVISELNQVFLNLIVNAAHAIDEVVKVKGGKGVITIETLSTDTHVEVRISDNGSGIPVAIRDRLFTPFFTTKGVGKGTGQGLYISRSIIVKTHGGTIHFENRPGGGTCFVVRIPLVPPKGAHG
jgi:PAS domain S-box-containing protein